MANLINAYSNQNYFQFHASNYKYEKGVPFRLSISRSIFKNFLKNLEFKFIKSSSKSKALIHYCTGCMRRHDTPFHPTHNVWIWQISVGTPHGPHKALCIITSFVTSSMEFMAFKRWRNQ